MEPLYAQSFSSKFKKTDFQRLGVLQGSYKIDGYISFFFSTVLASLVIKKRVQPRRLTHNRDEVFYRVGNNIFPGSTAIISNRRYDEFYIK